VSFKIKIPEQNRNRAEQLKNAIRMRAPQLKFGDFGNTPSSWITGTLNSDSSELEFFSDRQEEIRHDNTPAQDALLLNGDPRNDKVIIDIRLVNIADAGEYETELNFDWYSMDVKPQEDTTGEFAGFDLGTYLTELGGGVEFLSVFANLYLHIPNDIDVTVNITDRQGRPLPSMGIPPLDSRYIVLPDDEELPWLDNTPPIKYDFGGVLNEAQSIKYTIQPPSTVTVKREDLDPDQNTEITANLAVILPMAFRFSPGKAESLEIKDKGETNTYFSIGFKELDNFLEGDNSAMSQIEDQLGGGITGFS
jgi:hypothetical protein